jgi:hypothetical protein
MVQRTGDAPGIDRMTTVMPSAFALWNRGCVQPPDAENRTPGGVGGCRGAIPAPDSVALESSIVGTRF